MGRPPIRVASEDAPRTAIERGARSGVRPAKRDMIMDGPQLLSCWSYPGPGLGIPQPAGGGVFCGGGDMGARGSAWGGPVWAGLGGLVVRAGRWRRGAVLG